MTEGKIKVLFTTDWGTTGFGTVGRELCSRLASTGKYEIFYLGWHYTGDSEGQQLANAMGFRLLNTQFWKGMADQFGQASFDEVVDRVKPQIVITLGDPWMVQHVETSRNRKNFQWISYMPIDRDIMSKPWLNLLKDPDVLVAYSNFGKEVLENQLPYKHVELVLHGVDKTVFKPWRPEVHKDKSYSELKELIKTRVIGEDNKHRFVVGYVARNQVRKAIPRVINAFKAFNCKTWIERSDVEIVKGSDVVYSGNAEHFCKEKQLFRCESCPVFKQREETEDSIIYLHTTRGNSPDNQDGPGIGWRVDEIAHRMNLYGRLFMTPNITAIKGIPRDNLSMIIQCFDVHLFMSHSEGFGLPAAESVACGIPTLVTDYSSLPEIVAQGGGMTIKVRDFDTFVTFENTWANADIGDAADKVNMIFKDKDLAAKMSKEGENSDYILDWDAVSQQFSAILDRLCES